MGDEKGLLGPKRDEIHQGDALAAIEKMSKSSRGSNYNFGVDLEAFGETVNEEDLEKETTYLTSILREFVEWYGDNQKLSTDPSEHRIRMFLLLDYISETFGVGCRVGTRLEKLANFGTIFTSILTPFWSPCRL